MSHPEGLRQPSHYSWMGRRQCYLGSTGSRQHVSCWFSYNLEEQLPVSGQLNPGGQDPILEFLWVNANLCCQKAFRLIVNRLQNCSQMHKCQRFTCRHVGKEKPPRHRGEGRFRLIHLDKIKTAQVSYHYNPRSTWTKLKLQNCTGLSTYDTIQDVDVTPPTPHLFWAVHFCNSCTQHIAFTQMAQKLWTRSVFFIDLK